MAKQYGQAHRLFMQIMVERRSIDEVDAIDLMKTLCKEFKGNYYY